MTTAQKVMSSDSGVSPASNPAGPDTNTAPHQYHQQQGEYPHELLHAIAQSPCPQSLAGSPPLRRNEIMPDR